MNELPSALLEGEAVALLYINSVCACVVTFSAVPGGSLFR